MTSPTPEIYCFIFDHVALLKEYNKSKSMGQPVIFSELFNLLRVSRMSILSQGSVDAKALINPS
ncbi:hypothetical protein I7I50_05009 [Histoplasma capsulatum G186AR]|uniref:Uncharacterized protein n=1 Tax=Ajellomyces capsulatus TaxID=5037 RepID=A0A8H8D8D9_AJECA|nr:hypothetical protein I7I52_03267 [Histoplasma capsulatum]QSS75763.1 hypothetical protein I7I50_05009 [Histoplasma capsulatum G186AR]